MTSPVISWNDWENKYKPIKNPNNGDNDNLWDCMFETFGDDVQTMKDMEIQHEYFWTLVDNNPNSVYLDVIPGIHLFNRMGYFVTEIPWEDKDMVVSNDPSYA